MNMRNGWWIAALLVAAIGCSKSESGTGGTSGTSSTSGASSSAPASGAAGVAVSGAASTGPALASAAGSSTPTIPSTSASASSDAPEAQINDVLHAFAAGDASKVWAQLPAKYQSDVKSIVSEFSSKVDPDLWNKGFGLLGKLTKVLKEKKEFVLGSQIVTAFATPEVKGGASKNWDAVVGMLDTLATSEIKTIDGLKGVDVGKFVASTGNTLFSTGIKVAETSNAEAKTEIDRVRAAQVKLVKVEGDTATLSAPTADGTPKDKVFKKVDGKWLPAELVDGWDKGVADMKADMAAVQIPPEQKAGVMGAIAMAETTVDQLAAAKDQAEFDRILGGVMQMLGPMMGPGGGAPPGAPGAVPSAVPGLPGAAAPGGPSLTPPTITPPTVSPPK